MDYACAYRARKQEDVLVPLIGDLAEGVNSSAADVLATDEAATRLAGFNPSEANILEMHSLGCLAIHEIALQLGVSSNNKTRLEHCSCVASS